MMVRGGRKEGVAKRNRERGRGREGEGKGKEGGEEDGQKEWNNNLFFIYLSFYRLINWARYKGTSIHFDLLLNVFLDISFHHC